MSRADRALGAGNDECESCRGSSGITEKTLTLVDGVIMASGGRSVLSVVLRLGDVSRGLPCPRSLKRSSSLGSVPPAKRLPLGTRMRSWPKSEFVPRKRLELEPGPFSHGFAWDVDAAPCPSSEPGEKNPDCDVGNVTSLVKVDDRANRSYSGVPPEGVVGAGAAVVVMGVVGKGCCCSW